MIIIRNKHYDSDYFVELNGTVWNIYKDKGWWYCYLKRGLYYWDYQGMRKTRAKAIKEFVK